MTTKAQIQGLGAYEQWGFTLEHLGCEVVLLLHEGERVARFSQTGATPESLQAECASHLALCHHWDGCLWSQNEKGR
ncbi:hypothetical protein ES703_89897 [subsurface metagenome]